MKKHSM